MIKLLLKIFASLLLIILVFNNIDFGEVVSTIKKVDLLLLVITNLIFIFANVVLCPLKIKLLMKIDGYDVGFGKLVNIYWIGMFFNRFLPGGVGGDVIKMYDYSKLINNSEKAISSVLMERLSGVFAIVPIVLLFLMISYGELPFSLKVEVLLFSFFLLLGAVLLFSKSIMEKIIGALEGLRKIGPDKLISKLRVSYLSFYNYKNHMSVLFKVFILSVIFYMLSIFAMWLLALSIDYEVPLSYFFILIPIIFIVEMIPISISGIGVRESAYAHLFSLAGFSPTMAVSLSFLHFFLGIVNSAIGGIIFALRR